MPEIEGLQFNVTGESTKAQDSLQATIDKLEALSAKLAETKKSVSSLSKSLSGLGQNKGLSSFLSDLKKLTQSRSLSTFTKQLKSMQGEMNGIGQNIGAGIVQGIVSSSAQLSSVAREYIVNPVVEAVRSGFDVHSPSRVMAAIGKFLPAGLAKGITSAATAPVRAMQSVVSKVSAAAKSAVDKGVGGEALYRGYSGVAKAASGVKNRLSSALNGGAYSDRLGGAPLQGIHNAADTVLAKTASGVKALPGIFGSAKSAISSSAKSVAQHVQEQKGLNIHLGKTKTLLNGVGTGAKQTAAFMGRLASAPIKKLLSPLSAMQDKLKHIKYALLTVVTYGSIYRIISLFKTGLTDGLDNLYQYSLITGNQFAASMDRAATSLLYLKNSIGAAAAPLINALAPALDFVVDKVVTLLNRFNQLVSALSGKTTYTKAVKQQTKYAEAVKDTSDAEDDAKKKADELKRSLTSFDEIHALDDNSSKDSSSSKKNDSGTEIPDYGGMFTEEKIDGGIADFAKSLKDTIAKGDWQGLGKMLADKVNSTIDAIDWQGAGKKFGYGLNGIIQTSYYFLKYTDFAKIGNRFAQFLDMALAQVDFSKAGGLLVRKFTSLLDLIGGFLYGLNWGLVTKSITDFWTGFFDEWSAWLDEHDWTDIGEIFQRKLQQAIDNLDFDAIASSFWTAVSKSFRASVDVNFGFYDKISDELNAIMELFGGAELALGAVLCFSGANIPLGLVLMAFGAKNLIATAIVNWGSIETPVGKVLSTLQVILSGAALVVGSLLAFSGANIPLGIALMAAGAVNIASNAALNWDGCSDKVKAVISTITGFVGGALLAIGAIICFSGVAMPIGITLMAAGAASLASSIALDWSKSAKGVQAAAGTIVSLAGKMSFAIGAILCFSGVGIPLGIVLMAAGIGATVLGNSMNSQKGVDWGALGKKMVEVGEDVVLGFLKGLGWFGAHNPLEIAWTYIVEPLIDAVKKKLGIHSPSTVFADIGINTVKGLLNGILDGMKGIADWVKTNVTDPIVNKAKEGWEDAKTSTKTAWRDICDSVKTKGDEMSRKAEDAFTKAARAAKIKMEDMQNKVKNAIDKIKKFFAVTLGFKGIKLPSISVSWDTASAVGQALSKLGMPGVPNFHVNWNQYAEGGFPDEGELYIARENGSEMIGRMGNKNVVANNQQIIDGITRGVASANSQQNALLREQNELLRALLEKDTGISIGDITNAARRQNQRMGKTVIPVG